MCVELRTRVRRVAILLELVDDPPMKCNVLNLGQE